MFLRHLGTKICLLVAIISQLHAAVYQQPENLDATSCEQHDNRPQAKKEICPLNPGENSNVYLEIVDGKGWVTRKCPRTLHSVKPNVGAFL